MNPHQETPNHTGNEPRFAPIDGRALSSRGSVSMLVPCCGQLEHTRLCVASLLHHTRKPFELIFLDIGSFDGTKEFLAGVGVAASVGVEVVRATTDLSIPDACSEAFARAQGDMLVLLNN